MGWKSRDKKGRGRSSKAVGCPQKRRKTSKSKKLTERPLTFVQSSSYSHDQSPIPARFDANHTVGLDSRHRWLPDFSKIRARCGIRSTSAETSNEIIRCSRSQLQRVSRIRSFHCRGINSRETGTILQEGDNFDAPSTPQEADSIGPVPFRRFPREFAQGS